MKEIIPTILVSNRLEFERRLGIMAGKIPVAQMDIMDGKFVANTTFTDPKIAAQYRVDYELDLMVEDPESFLQKWHDTLPQPPPIKGGGKVVRAFVHVEIKKPLAPLLEKIKSYGWETGIALNPDTPWERVKKFLDKIDTVLFMTVYPGQNAAPFQPKVISKIKAFHHAHPKVPIEVDGGVNERTLPLLLKAGVTRFAVGSAIWSTPDPLKAYKKLLKVALK